MSNNHVSSSLQKVVEEAIANEPSWSFVSCIMGVVFGSVPFITVFRDSLFFACKTNVTNLQFIKLLDKFQQKKKS